MWYLVILFIINSEPTIIDGWHPIANESEEACNQKQQTITDYLDSLNLEYEFVVSCNKEGIN